MFSIRQYEPDQDLLRLHQLLTAVEAHDQDGEEVSEEALRQQLTWNNYDPRLDSWVIEDPDKLGELIGYASVAGRAGGRCTVYTAVHPDWRRRGLGTRLLDQALERGKETGADHFIVYANAQNDSAIAFLRRRGYEPVGASWILSASAAQAFAEPVWPPGFRVHSFAEVEDFAILAEISNRSYGDMWGHSQNEQPATPEGISEMGPAYWPPESVFLAFAPDGDAVGLCLGIPGESVNVIDSPGVAPEYRHLELQRPLLLTVARHLQSEQPKDIQLLSYGDDAQTISIYQDIGFCLDAHYIAYHGELEEKVQGTIKDSVQVH